MTRQSTQTNVFTPAIRKWVYGGLFHACYVSLRVFFLAFIVFGSTPATATEVVNIDAALPNDALSQEGVAVRSKGVKPIPDSTISLRPVLVVEPQVAQRLERQFKQIQTLLETENAFSEKLGENYYGYGKLLTQVARIDEARDALLNALHISKVNNGIEAIEQRAILRDLFEISYAQRKLKEADTIAKKIVLIEKKRPNNDDLYAFDILMRLGHLHLNKYLDKPLNGYEGLSMINRTIARFDYIHERYGNLERNDVLMPYGELAYLWYLKSKIRVPVERDPRPSFGRQGLSSLVSDRAVVSPESARAKGLAVLHDFHTKALSNGDLENAVIALLNKGDLNLIYGRQVAAQHAYFSAWDAAQSLPSAHPLLNSFETVVKLPNFQYGLQQTPNYLNKDYEEVPLLFSINMNGTVKRVKDNLDRKQYGSSVGRAKRFARKFKFRPILEKGKPIKLSHSEYLVQLPVK